MKKKFPSRTFALMITATVMLIFMMGSAFAQVQISNDCPDKCERDTLYLKGVWNENIWLCSYDYQEVCKYGCKDNSSCSEFPDTPPVDVIDYDETLWMMQRSVYDSARIEVSIGATEYTLGDNATIFAKVTEYGMGVNDAFCDAMIFNSTQDEIMGFEMTRVPNSRGMYSYTTQVPDEYGVYMADVQCYKPVNETIQTHYFYGEGTPAYDLGFKNQSGSAQTYIVFEDVNSVYLCHPDRFSVAFGDFESGEFEEYRFLHGVHNQTVYVSKAVGVEKEYTIVLRFYKETEKGELTLGAAINHTGVGTTIKEITFPDTVFNEPFDSMCLLEVEICIRTAHDVGNDVTFWFNSTNESARFDVHGLAVNASVDFEVGGSSEIHVSDVPYETYLTFATMPEPILTSNHDFCIDNSTLGKTLTWEQCVSGRCDNVSRNVTDPCPYGCFGNETAGQCNPEPIDKYILMLIFLFVVVVIIVVIALAYNKWG